MVKSLPLSEASLLLDDLIDEIVRFGHEYEITKNGRALVRMIPIDGPEAVR